MAAYTPSLRLTLPVTGTDDGTWGDTVNNGITSLTDAAIAGTATVVQGDVANYTLTSNSGATDEARNMFLNITGALTATRNVICPTASKLYFIKNSTTGGFAVTLKTSGGTGISVPAGSITALYCDGTNVVDAITYANIPVINATTVDTTNLEVTNIKAKDGTASITMADTTGIATFSKATVISTADATNAALRITQTGAGSALVVEDSTSPDATPFLIDAAGRVIAGYTALVAPDVNGPTIFPQMNVVGVTSTAQYAAFSYINAAANAPIVALSKSRGATIGTNTIVVNGDTIGIVKFTAADGTAFVPAASISAQVDGTPGLNDMPGRLVFNTTADGAATSTERMRIDSAGNVGIGTITPSSDLHVARNDATSYDGAATDGQLAAGSTVFIQQTAGTNTGVAQIVFQPRSTFPYNRIVSSGGSAPFMTFVTNNAEAMRITSAQILSTTKDALINGLTVGRGGGALSSNTAVGASALVTNTTGQNNIAIGDSALSQSNSFNNVAVGWSALNILTSGVYNVATGSSAGVALTTGSYNVLNGGAAGAGLTLGNYNVLIGQSAGAAITSGSKNTVLGSYDGNTGGLDIRTASNYIVLSDGDGNPRQIIDSSGNLGLGVTPSAWYVANSNRAIQIGSYLSLLADNQNGYASLANNAYQSTINQASGWNYVTTNAAAKYTQTLGSHAWYNAPSGTAGAAITFTQAMTLDASGNLGVGTTSPSTKLDIAGTLRIDTTSNIYGKADNTSFVSLYGGGAYNAGAGIGLGGTSQAVNPNIIVFTRGSYVETARFDAAGNLGLGVTPSAWSATLRGFDFGPNGALVGQTGGGNGGVSFARNAYFNGANWIYKQTSTAQFTELPQTGGFQWNTAPSGTAGNVITFTQAMTLDASGYLGVGTTSPSTYAARITAFASTSLANIALDSVSGQNTAINWYLNGSIKWSTQVIADGTNAYRWYNFTAGSEAMRLDASGNLLVGGTARGLINSNAIDLDVTDASVYISHPTGTPSGNYFSAFGYAGTGIGSITQNGTTGVLYNINSDYRLKNITGPITTSGAYIDSLKPVEGTWKADGSTFVGLIAHETQEVSRTTVATGTKDGEQMQGMDYSSAEIIANLIAEIQDLRKRLAAAGI